MIKDNLHIFDCDIRGHFKNQLECKELVVGDMIWLMPEPDNEYDEFAIRVLNSQGKDLGYIPGEHNQEILGLLGSEKAEYCSKITQIEKSDNDEILPWITIYISKNKNQLPFQQENRLKFHSNLDDENNASKLIINESNNAKEDDSKNLFIGILFIVGLIVIAKLISMI
jgi:hypothetical protein